MSRHPNQELRVEFQGDELHLVWRDAVATVISDVELTGRGRMLGELINEQQAEIERLQSQLHAIGKAATYKYAGWHGEGVYTVSGSVLEPAIEWAKEVGNE